MSLPLSADACSQLTAMGPAVDLGGHRFRTLSWGSERNKAAAMPRHHHTFCEIILLHAGHISCEWAESMYPADAPAVLVSMPGEPHHHDQSEPVDINWWSLTVERRGELPTDGLEPLVSAWVMQRNPVASGNNRIMTIAADLEHELARRAPGWRHAVSLILQRLILQIIRATALTRPPEPETDLVCALREAIRSQPQLDWSVAELAALVGVSERQLGRLLQRHAKCSPRALVTAERMVLAEALLLADDMTVKTVAARLGYHDHRYFARLFKGHRGMSPQAWRAAADDYRITSPSPE